MSTTTERIAKLRQQAQSADLKAQRCHEQASEISSRFADGQPIILKHHSTKRARQDRDHADKLTQKALRWQRKRDDLGEQARRLKTEQQRRDMIADAPTYGPDDVTAGDIVWCRPGRGTQATPHRVEKVNTKSVAVDTGHSWTERIAYSEIIRITRPDNEEVTS